MTGSFVATFLSGTEIYSVSKMEWVYAGLLPTARTFSSNGISVLNNVFVLGKLTTTRMIICARENLDFFRFFLN